MSLIFAQLLVIGLHVLSTIIEYSFCCTLINYQFPHMHQTRAKSSIETKHSATSRQDNDEADKKEEKEQDVVNNTEQTSGHNEINTL